MPAGLQGCLGSMLREFERTVGFAEGVVMSFDPDVLLPNAFAASVERGLDDAVLACRNEQLDHDFLKFRDLASGPVRVGVAGRDGDPRVRTSRRWLEILDVPLLERLAVAQAPEHRGRRRHGVRRQPAQ